MKPEIFYWNKVLKHGYSLRLVLFVHLMDGITFKIMKGIRIEQQKNFIEKH